MKNEWADAVITKIAVAVHVTPNTGKHVHKDRPFHGFVLNDESSVKNYVFDNGEVMRTEENTVFYLPKGSSYHVEQLCIGGCYAINFDADVEDKPFCIKPKNYESLKKSFKSACDGWQMHNSLWHAAAMRALYHTIYLLQNEREQGYMPNERRRLILPALELIERNCTVQGLTVAALAAACGISTVYFRKIFLHEFGVSPKEYIIDKRIDYARRLLSHGELEVSQVAMMCGYTEPCHFSREFSKRVGVSPSKYFDK